MILTLALTVVLALVFTLTLSVFFALSGAIASQYNGLFMRKSDSNGLFVNRAIWSTQCAMNDNAPNSTILAIRAETCIWHLPNLHSVRSFFSGWYSFIYSYCLIITIICGECVTSGYFLADLGTHIQRMYANFIQFILSKRTEYDAVLFTLVYFLFVMLIDVFISVYALIIDGNDIFFVMHFFRWIQYLVPVINPIRMQRICELTNFLDHAYDWRSWKINTTDDCLRFLQWLHTLRVNNNKASHVYNSWSDLKKKMFLKYAEKRLFLRKPHYIV